MAFADGGPHQKWILENMKPFSLVWQEWVAHCYATQTPYGRSPVPPWYVEYSLWYMTEGQSGRHYTALEMDKLIWNYLESHIKVHGS